MPKLEQSALIGASPLKAADMKAIFWSITQVSLQGIGHLLADV